MNDCINTTKQSTTKPCAYFLGYTVLFQYLIPLQVGLLGNLAFQDFHSALCYCPLSSEWGCSSNNHTVYPRKYAHGFVVLCFVVVMQSFIMNSHEESIHIHQGCFAGTGAIVRLPQCQWSKPDGYGKISQCITTTKHSKAKTVCIFLGIYCISQHTLHELRYSTMKTLSDIYATELMKLTYETSAIHTNGWFCSTGGK